VGNKFCDQCGVQLIASSSFCGQCGAKVSPAIQVQETQQSNPGDSNVQDIPKSSETKSFATQWAGVSQKNRVMILIFAAIVILVSLFQSGGGSSSTPSAASSMIDGLVMSDVSGEYTGFSCSDTQITDSLTCILAISVKNNSSAAVHLYGDIYALVDGMVFKATTTYGGIDYVSTDINPGESQSATISFDVPSGSNISDIFIADNASEGLNGAKVSFSLNKLATV
jgi:hypothetical protein